MNIVKAHLPKVCYDHSGKTIVVNGAVIHFVSAVRDHPEDPFSLKNILKIFIRYKVSCHFYIDREGKVHELVPLPHKAWHAGRSIMGGRKHCNSFTVGIELAGGTKFDYTSSQLASLYHLLAELIVEYKFTVDDIKGHDEVRKEWNDTYPDKKVSVKVDPGEHFPWEELRNTLAAVG